MEEEQGKAGARMRVSYQQQTLGEKHGALARKRKCDLSHYLNFRMQRRRAGEPSWLTQSPRERGSVVLVGSLHQ